MIDLKEMESVQQSAQQFNEAVAKAARASFERGYTDGFAEGYKHGHKDAQLEIIRCKDCKWSDWYDVDGYKYCYCIETGVSERTADDFCSKAERRKKHERFNQQKIST